MENQNRSRGGLWGILAVVGGALLVKRMKDRKRAMRDTMEEFGVTERSPFAIADQIRVMDQDKYDGLKAKLQAQFDRNRCRR